MGPGRRDGLGDVGRWLVVAMRTYLALGVILVLVVLASPARGQNWDRWFRVSWGAPGEWEDAHRENRGLGSKRFAVPRDRRGTRGRGAQRRPAFCRPALRVGAG
jgi:hypothetical protein